jgi:ribose transport system permease protein
VITTIAMLSVVQGIALYLRPSPFGVISEDFIDFFQTRAGFIPVSLFVFLAAAIGGVLRKTTVGRHFSAVGANPRAAWIAGINVAVYQTAAFTVAAFLYGIAGVLVSAFIRNPTLKVGEPYLLAPIAAAVLGGTAMSGGIGSMVAVAGAALFLTQLGQMLQMLGLSSALQFAIQGIAIALGMALSRIDAPLAPSPLLRLMVAPRQHWAAILCITSLELPRTWL